MIAFAHEETIPGDRRDIEVTFYILDIRQLF